MTSTQTWLYLTPDPGRADLLVYVTPDPAKADMWVYVTSDARRAEQWAFRTSNPQLADATIYVVNPDGLAYHHGAVEHEGTF